MIRVLVVDDDFMVAKVHCGFVERVPGFSVVGVAHTGEEAVRAAGEIRPDLLLLDIYLPDMCPSSMAATACPGHRRSRTGCR